MPSHRRVPCLLLAAALVVASPLALAEDGIYKSRDAQGNVIFSDKPGEAAEAVVLPRTNTMPEAALPSEAAPTAEPTGESVDFSGYESMAIVSPTDGQTVSDPAGSLEVNIDLNPPLQPEHSLRLLLDGEPAGVPQQGTLRLEGLSRGTHSLQAQVVDANGEILQSSSTISVQVQRPDGRRIGPFRKP